MPARKARAYRMTTRTASMHATRERILEAALALFSHRPYDLTTLKELADAAEVSLPTVLSHFGSKDGLLAAMIAWHAPRENAARECPPGDALAAARILVGRYETFGRATVRLLALEERSAAVANLTRQGRAAHRAWVERTFARAIAAAPAGAARKRRIVQLVAALDVYTWDIFRRVLSVEETVLAMAESLKQIGGEHVEWGAEAVSPRDVGGRRHDSAGAGGRAGAARARPRGARPR